MRYVVFVITFMLLAGLRQTPAVAAVINVDFNDSDGPHWTGLVNTTTDVLTINTWTENAGGAQFWTPTASMLPWVWNAVDQTGATFDVPDNWDGMISTTWGFLSPEALGDVTWNEGAYIGTKGYPGWGVSANQANTPNTSFDNTTTTKALVGNATPEDSSGTVTITAIPEPGTMALLGVGYCVIGGIGWTRRKRKSD